MARNLIFTNFIGVKEMTEKQKEKQLIKKVKAYNTSTKTPEEIQKIKEKYKHGIPEGEIKRWILEKE